MKYCPECGKELKDTMRFCINCGADLNKHRESEARRKAALQTADNAAEPSPFAAFIEPAAAAAEQKPFFPDAPAYPADELTQEAVEVPSPAELVIHDEPEIPDTEPDPPARPDEPELPDTVPDVSAEIPVSPDEIPEAPDTEPDLPAGPEQTAEPEAPAEPEKPESVPAAASCAAYQPKYKEAIRRSRDHLYYADARLALPAGSFDFRDDLSAEAQTMLAVQLTDTSLWAKFVDLFRHPGVDDADYGWRCEYWGKMMRGACFTYAALPAAAADAADRLYAVLEGTVRDLLTAQDDLGRFSTYSVDAEFTGWDIWGRKYVLLGTIYFLDICRDDALADEIVEALMRHTDYMISKLGRPEEGKRLIAACTSHWDGLNSCSVLEPVMLLYNITHERRYFDFAEYIISFGGTLHRDLFALAREDKVSIVDYGVTKAYEMISCFEGLAEYAKVTGSRGARESVVRFAERVLREEETIIGCLGCDYESFDRSAAEQFNGAHRGIMQETCVTVTWMKFCWQLWRMTGEAKWIDAIERSAYNAMSAALRRRIDPTANGGVPLPVHSYNPLRHDVRSPVVGGRKNITEASSYGCCVCISTAGFALDTLAAAAEDRKGTIYVNLYRNGSITVGDFRLTMETDYPASGVVRFSVNAFEGERTLVLRIPGWTERAALIAGGISTEQKDGCFTLTVGPETSFTLAFDMPVKVVTPEEASHGLASSPEYLAVRRGPVFFALDECEEEEPVVPLDAERMQRWGMGEAVSPDSASVPCRLAVRVPLRGAAPVVLVDYASAGQEEGHKVCAWLKQS